MFVIGQYVACGNKGVCSVEDITTLDISGVDKSEKYYILKPAYNSASTIYIPVSAEGESLRPVLTAEEARALIANISEVELIDIPNEKQVEALYKNCIRSNDIAQFAKLIKTIHGRRRMRTEAGRKETAIDAKYSRIVSDFFFGELAISLDITKKDVEAMIPDSNWD